MKNIIYYFSGTGNSLQVARDLAAGLTDCKLQPITEQLHASIKKEPVKAERIGFVFPVYAWGPPALVLRFAKLLQKTAETYYFAATTCGGSSGGTLKKLARRLKKNDINLSAGFVLPMPTNYISWSGALPEEKQQKFFRNESEKIKEILPIIKEKKEHKIESSFFLTRLISGPIYSLSIKMFKGMDKKFTINKNCNGCAICEKICPVDNISMKDSIPEWQHRCEQCYACIQWCPQEAINIGKKTINRKRYRNPQVTIKDMFYR